MEYGRALSVFHVSAYRGWLVDKWNGAPPLLGCDSGAFGWLAGAGQTGGAQGDGVAGAAGLGAPAHKRTRRVPRWPEPPGATRRQTPTATYGVNCD